MNVKTQATKAEWVFMKFKCFKTNQRSNFKHKQLHQR